MTTVIYHKRILAADTRTTKQVIRDENEYVCKECKTVSDTVKDNTVKLEIILNCKFRNENILAMACSGLVQDKVKLIKLFKANEDVEHAEKVNSLLSGKSIFSNMSAIIVTDQNVYKLEAGSFDKLHITKYGLDDTVCIGSGCKAALLMTKIIGADATDAVMATMLVDEGTGGDVHFVDLTPEKVNKVELQKHIVNKDKFSDAIFQSIKGYVENKAVSAPEVKKPRKPRTKVTGT